MTDTSFLFLAELVGFVTVGFFVVLVFLALFTVTVQVYFFFPAFTCTFALPDFTATILTLFFFLFFFLFFSLIHFLPEMTFHVVFFLLFLRVIVLLFPTLSVTFCYSISLLLPLACAVQAFPSTPALLQAAPLNIFFLFSYVFPPSFYG